MIPKLYGYWRSSATWRVRWAFELKKLPYEYIPVNILKEEHRGAEHLARTPLGTLPVLEPTLGTYLSQSMAILLWMDENYAREPYIFGKDRTHRYKILELCEIINADTAPLQTPRAQKRAKDEPTDRADFAKHFIKLGLDAFEKQVASFNGRYCLGDEVTAADLFLIPQMYNARRFEISFDEYRRCKSIWETCMATPECQKSSPEKQIDAT